MSAVVDPKQDAAEIHALMDDWLEAVRAKDGDRLVRHYAPEVLVCDLRPPLHYVGADRYRQNCEGWFSSWPGPIRCERKDLSLSVGGEVAFAVCLTHNQGAMPDGREIDFWVRVTLGFRRIEGEWKVVHEHVSVPFDMQTAQALFDLRPE